MRITSRNAIVFFFAVLAAGLAGRAGADTTLHYQVSRDNNTEPLVLKAQPGEIRVEGAAVGGQFKWMVYRSADNTLYAVDPERELYLALDPAAIDRIAQQMDAMRADLRQRLDEMPIGQRKFVKSQVGDFLKQPEGEPATMKIDMSGAEAQVNQVACRKGQIINRGQPAGELCVASTDALGLTNAEFDAYKGLYKLINSLQAAMSSDAVQAPDITTLSGVPVRMRIESSGMTETLEQVAHHPLPDKLFEIPEGYQRKEPQDLMQ